MRGATLAARRWAGFGKNIFSEMSELASACGAVNLAQGFPDEPGPARVLQALRNALDGGIHQYAPYVGEPGLREAVSGYVEAFAGLAYCPKTEITITSGATEAIYCCVNAFVNPGDRVLVFDPCFDTYAQAVANAGGVLVAVKLHPPDSPQGLRWGGWAIDWDDFDLLAKEGFSFAIINSPHNPTGKVFGVEELLRIADAVKRNNALVLSDEVYENILFDGAEHTSLASLPGMRDRVLRVSSVAKSFGFTGFKLGWVCASPQCTSAVRLVHQAVVFCTPSHIQLGFAEVLRDAEWTRGWIDSQRVELASRQNALARALSVSGFRVELSKGTYFLLGSCEDFESCSDAASFSRSMVRDAKIACLPVSAFSTLPSHNFFWLRFAFCKSRDTIARAEKLLRVAYSGASNFGG